MQLCSYYVCIVMHAVNIICRILIAMKVHFDCYFIVCVSDADLIGLYVYVGNMITTV